MSRLNTLTTLVSVGYPVWYAYGVSRGVIDTSDGLAHELRVVSGTFESKESTRSQFEKRKIEAQNRLNNLTPQQKKERKEQKRKQYEEKREELEKELLNVQTNFKNDLKEKNTENIRYYNKQIKDIKKDLKELNLNFVEI